MSILPYYSQVGGNPTVAGMVNEVNALGTQAYYSGAPGFPSLSAVGFPPAVYRPPLYTPAYDYYGDSGYYDTGFGPGFGRGYYDDCDDGFLGGGLFGGGGGLFGGGGGGLMDILLTGGLIMGIGALMRSFGGNDDEAATDTGATGGGTFTETPLPPAGPSASSSTGSSGGSSASARPASARTRTSAPPPAPEKTDVKKPAKGDDVELIKT